MKKLSVTIITYNEEQNIREALESVQWANEIIVVDAFSSDKTLQICQAFHAKTYQRAWSGYVDQKNFAVDQTTHDWILSIDADERVSPALREELLQWKTRETDADGYLIPRKSFFLGKWIRHTSWYPDYQLRLFDKTTARWEGGNVHESVAVKGNVARLKEELWHYSYRSISDFLIRLNRYSDLAAKDYALRKKPVSVFTLLLAPYAEFVKNFILKRGFQDGPQGLIISVFSAISVFFKYAKLWELKFQSKEAITNADREADIPRSILFMDTETGWRGGQEQLFSLMLGIRDRGFRVSLVAAPESPLALKAQNESIETYPIRIRNELDIGSFYKLYQLVRSKRFQIIHYNTPRPILLGNLLASIMKIQRRVVSRSVDFPLRRPVSRLKYLWGIDKIIAVSYNIKNTLVKHGISPHRIEVIHEGIDLSTLDLAKESLSSDASREYVGTVGSLSEEKGTKFLIEAAAELCGRRPNLHVIIVGDGQLKPKLEQLAADLRVQDKVIFTGFRDDFFKVMSSFKVFVLPSLSEGFGVVILYAMAARLPVVASWAGGIPEIVDDKVTGLLVPAGDSKALTRAIGFLLDHPDQAAAMGSAGRKRLKDNFSLQTKIDRTISIYDRLLQDKKTVAGSQ